MPFEDNIVAQLLCEYQDTLEDEMRVTPARAQPTAPSVAETATDTNNPPPAGAPCLPLLGLEQMGLHASYAASVPGISCRGGY